MQVMTEPVTIGRVLKPFGVKGKVRVESLTDVPGRFENLPSVTLVTSTGESLTTTITQAKPSGNSYLLKFAAFASPEEAATLRGALIQVPQESVPPSLDGQYYQFELIGLAVQDETGKVLGNIEDILDLPQHPVLVARHEKEEFLIPATRLVVKHIDKETKLITVTPVEQWGASYAV